VTWNGRWRGGGAARAIAGRLARVALVAASLAGAPAAHASVAESWYLARGQANLGIANYAAAIEAFEAALRENPASREASRGLALAYERNGETDRAVAQRDRHLARFPDDADVAFEQARVLQWSRYAYRSRDAVRYLRLGLARRDDPARRAELARLLARDRATLDDALAEYRRLLGARPDDAALRREYVRLLLWDPSHRAEATRELERWTADHPGDDAAARDLARLLATDPRRAGEAASRFEALLARQPRDPDLLLGRARALAAAGRRAEAAAAYDRALAARPSLEVRLERADLLAADPGTRDRARAEYEAVLREAPRSRRARVGLGRILAARKETSRAAIAQYQAVLADSPGDPEAHAALARAYAWNGDADEALAHGDAARGSGGGEVDALRRSLRAGREPSAGAALRLVLQPDGPYALHEAALLASGSADPTPFTSSAVEAGWARASGGGVETSGAVLLARGEVRPRPGVRVSGQLGWDGLRLAAALTGGVRLDLGEPADGLSVVAERTARSDSFRARAGERVGEAIAGAASENAIEVRLARPLGPLQATASLRAGAITAGASRPDAFGTVRAGATLPLALGGGWTVTPGAEVLAATAARDESGLGPAPDPLSPRVFTPPLFASAAARVAVAREDPRGRLDAELAPAVQLVGGAGGSVRGGGMARAAYTGRFGWLRLQAEVRAEQIADVYRRVAGGLAAAALF
jgi:tetratricopeptide (TPR) repeat protein